MTSALGSDLLGQTVMFKKSPSCVLLENLALYVEPLIIVNPQECEDAASLELGLTLRSISVL